jgi:hypothetical protein
LILGNNVTLQGRGSSVNTGNALVKVNSGGNLTMRGSSKITNNFYQNTSGAALGGGVHFASSGTFTMEGGTITGNKVDGSTLGKGGGIYFSSDAVFNMSGGTISDNTSVGHGTGKTGPGFGGGVCLDGQARFTMTGGSISNNRAEGYTPGSHDAWGGGIYINDPNATFVMSGSAAISGNTAEGRYVRGGGVSIGEGSLNSGHVTFTMSGGSITYNTAKARNSSDYPASGGGVYSEAPFKMTDGTIDYNTVIYVADPASGYCLGGGAGVAISRASSSSSNPIASFEKTGGLIYGPGDNKVKNKNEVEQSYRGHAVLIWYNGKAVTSNTGGSNTTYRYRDETSYSNHTMNCKITGSGITGW